MPLIFQRIKKGSAFTLVEVIVVLFIISLSLVGVLSLIVQSLNSQTYNRNNLIAYQLAQEGVELVRRLRDSSMVRGDVWDYNLNQPDRYYMDYADNALIKTIEPSEEILRLDAKGFYVHDSSGMLPDSGFSRRIIIVEKPLGTRSIRLRVEVSWRDRGRNYSYNLETFLYGWLNQQ